MYSAIMELTQIAGSVKIASNILTNRMEKLVEYGIFQKTKNKNNKLKFDYLLTKKGKDLEPILRAMANWGKENIEGANDLEDIIKLFGTYKSPEQHHLL